MKYFALTAAVVALAGVARQASAEEPHHRKHHEQVCHIERHKVKIHGKWVIKETKFCK